MWRRAVDKCYHRFWLCLSSLIWTQIDLHNEPSVRHFTMRSKASIISSSCRPAAHTLLQPQESASLLSESHIAHNSYCPNCSLQRCGYLFWSCLFLHVVELMKMTCKLFYVHVWFYAKMKESDTVIGASLWLTWLNHTRGGS